jgi:hypothetical protein
MQILRILLDTLEGLFQGKSLIKSFQDAKLYNESD